MSSSKLFLLALGFAVDFIVGSVDADAAAPRSKQRSRAWSNTYPYANGAPVRNPYFGAGSTCFRSAGTGRLICSAEDALFDRSNGGRKPAPSADAVSRPRISHTVSLAALGISEKYHEQVQTNCLSACSRGRFPGSNFGASAPAGTDS